MTLLGIFLILLLGILLILLEFFVVPGITVAGIGGLILLITGLSFAYVQYGAREGHYFLGGTVVVLLIIFIFVFRTGTWKRISLKSTIDSNIKDNIVQTILVGDEGKSITRMNPVGNVLVKNNIFEAESREGFIDEDSEIEVVKIVKSKIFIKLKLK